MTIILFWIFALAAVGGFLGANLEKAKAKRQQEQYSKRHLN